MTNLKTSASAFADTKPHYELLDGLRGVAALLVIWYHVFEGFAFAQEASIIKGINHGYLAVDFFFMLSGFVISYAYDDRWKTSLTLGNFFKRRLIRLHPMVILSALIGTATFCIQGCIQWDGTHIATSMVMLAMLCSMFFIPAVSGHSCYEVRGNGEMFPLNGPSWSLFFEYIGNILYALFIRRLSTTMLTILVIILAIAHAWFAFFDISQYGSIGVGWTLDTTNFFGGLLRMMFPFTMGMLLARKFKPIKISGAFWICSISLLLLFLVPYLNKAGNIHINGIYESVCVIILFPLLVWLGASGSTTDKKSTELCNFLGNISYPIYIIHYPVMYLFYAWLIDNKLYTLSETWHVVIPLFIGLIVLAHLCLKLYDEPVRRFLSHRFLSKKKRP